MSSMFAMKGYAKIVLNAHRNKPRSDRRTKKMFVRLLGDYTEPLIRPSASRQERYAIRKPELKVYILALISPIQC